MPADLQSERDFEIHCLKVRITDIIILIQDKSEKEISIPKSWAKELTRRFGDFCTLMSNPLPNEINNE